MVPTPVPPPNKPATEEMLTIFPERFGIMQRRPMSWVRKKTAFTLRLMTLCQPSAGYSSAGAPQVAPALFTRMSMVPNFASALSTIPGMVDKALAKFGTIDILVNNAGATWGAPAEEYPAEGWHKVINLNVNAVFFLTQDIGRRCMIPKRSGKIVNISSVAGL